MTKVQTPDPERRLTGDDKNPGEALDLAGEQSLSPDQAWSCVELVAADPEAIDQMRTDMGEAGDQVVPYIVHALCVEVARQHAELETFAIATRVVGAMVNGLMDAEMADDAGELLTKLHAAGRRERAAFLASDKRLVVDVAQALVAAAEKAVTS
jgi:hypothetical protein